MLVNVRRLACAAACGFMLLTAPAVAAAQTAADTAGVLLDVATRLKSEGRSQLSRSLLDLIIERYAGTPAAAQAARLRNELRAGAAEQSGRTELIVFGTTYGLWLGAAIPAALAADEPTPYGVGLILGGPIGFVASRAYARGRPLSEGQARAITFGGSWGTWQGLGWANVFDFGADEYCTEFQCDAGDDPSGRAIVTSMLAGGVIGIGIGAALSQKHITPGTATTVNFGGLWGTWFGTAVAVAGSASGDAIMTSALLGGNGGILAAALGARHWQLSRSRARLISISGVAGLVAGMGVLLIAQPDGDASILVPAATSALGLGLGVHWTRRMEAGGNEGEREGERDGWGWEGPSMQPRIVERVRNGRLERLPALGMTLFQARF